LMAEGEGSIMPNCIAINSVTHNSIHLIRRLEMTRVISVLSCVSPNSGVSPNSVLRRSSLY